MIALLAQLEVCISQRLDQIEMLREDDEERLALSLKEDQRKRQIIRNFRLIKKEEKSRSDKQEALLVEIGKAAKQLSRNQFIQLEEMLVFAVNRYLNCQLICQKRGSADDVVDVFEACYRMLRAQRKLREMRVVRNLQLFEQSDFLRVNLTYLLAVIRESLSAVLERQRANVCRILKIDKSISPDRRIEDDQPDQDRYLRARSALSTKRKHQLYCYQLSRVLGLQYVYIDYFYFNRTLYGGEPQKKRRILEANIMKRNLPTTRQVELYRRQYAQRLRQA